MLLLGTALAMERPHVAVVASLGLPNLVDGAVEVFLTPAVSVEVGGGIGLLPLALHGGGRWHKTFPAGWDGHHFRVAPGATVYFFPTELGEGLAVADVDLAWTRTGPVAGVTAGLRLGAGLAFGPGSEGVKLEPGIEIVPLRVGAIF